MVKNDEWEKIEPDTPFWNPTEENDYIEGIITEFEDGDYGLQANIRDPDDNIIVTPSHKNLQNKLKKVSVGDYVRIMYVGEQDIGQPSLMKVYEVFRKKE